MKILYGNLYLADLNPQKGTEPGKLRPVLVMQTNLLNEINHPSTWILPCTTRLTGESLIRVFLPKGIAGYDVDCEIMILIKAGQLIIKDINFILSHCLK